MRRLLIVLATIAVIVQAGPARHNAANDEHDVVERNSRGNAPAGDDYEGRNYVHGGIEIIVNQEVNGRSGGYNHDRRGKHRPGKRPKPTLSPVPSPSSTFSSSTTTSSATPSTSSSKTGTTNPFKPPVLIIGK